MKKVNTILFLVGILLNACVSTNKFTALNHSLKTLIQPKSEWRKYPIYVLKSRKETFKSLKISLDSLEDNTQIAVIEEYDPLASHYILSELFFYGFRPSIYYEKLNNNESIFSEKKITGRNTILKYLEKNDIGGLKGLAKEKSKQLTDGSWIFISIYSKKKAYSFLIPQFSIK